MQLSYPFPLEVRKMYIDCWTCWICSQNGQQSGGLELHHVLGRISDSIFNSSVLCHKCHSHMGHSQEEEQQLFLITLKYLYDLHYVPIEKDYDFLKMHYTRLVNDEIFKWLKLL